MLRIEHNFISAQPFRSVRCSSGLCRINPFSSSFLGVHLVFSTDHTLINCLGIQDSSGLLPLVIFSYRAVKRAVARLLSGVEWYNSNESEPLRNIYHRSCSMHPHQTDVEEAEQIEYLSFWPAESDAENIIICDESECTTADPSLLATAENRQACFFNV